jgi:hypothetical protein
MVCGSTTPTTDDYYFGTPGRPTTADDGDYYNDKACKKVDEKDEHDPNCVERCIISYIVDDWRPTFAIGPLGTDCQEWTDNKIEVCVITCSISELESTMDFISKHPKPSSRYK